LATKNPTCLSSIVKDHAVDLGIGEEERELLRCRKTVRKSSALIDFMARMI
jgi:hypothetical protein